MRAGDRRDQDHGRRTCRDRPVRYVHDFGSKIPAARPSMLLDHMAERMSEIDALNGAIPPAAEAVGVATPFNTVVSALVRARERRMGIRA